VTPGTSRVISLLFMVAAIAWPLDLLQYIPGLGISLLSLVSLLLLPLLLLDALAQQKLRVPFEVLAPAAIVLGGIGADAARRGPQEGYGDAVSALLLMAAVIHFAPPRDVIRRYLLASVISGFAATLLSLVAPIIHLMPTAYSLRSGVTFTFPYTVPAGVHILLVVVLTAIYAARDRRYTPIERTVATLPILFFAAALAGAAIHWARTAHTFPAARYPVLTAAQVVAMAAALWLCARLLAKIAVDRRRAPDPLHGLWWTIAAGTLAVAAWAPIVPGAYQGFLAGLACASVLPARDAVRAVRRPVVAAVLPALLFATNALLVPQGNARDPRQYDIASRRDFEAGRFGRLLTRLDAVERLAPAERRTHLWRARAALALGQPNWASFEYLRAIEPPAGRTLLPPPSRAERQDFVVRMRDAVAPMPDAIAACAFERTLLAEGERDSAIYSMRLETAVPLTHTEFTDPAPFAGAAARIIGDASLTTDFGAWQPGELITLLLFWGAQLEEAPAAPAPPFVVMAQRTLDGLDVFVYTAGATTLVHRDIAPPDAADAVRLIEAGALRWSGPVQGPGVTRYALRVERGAGPEEVGALELRDNGAVKFELAPGPPPIPFTPAIRMRLDD
jgi:hypothetical protein